jgi:hypothetical protein
MGLRERFESFVKTMRGFEGVDALLRDDRREKRRRADYLLSERTIIVEQKVLKVDQAHRPQQFIDRLMKERGILAYGRHSTDVIFNRLPDGQKLKREMFLRMTKGFEEDIAVADKQTRDTRAIFSIPEAIGIVVILNEGAAALPPELLGFGLHNVLNKRRNDGSIRYLHNDGVVVISEAHVLIDSNGGRGLPCFATRTPQARSPNLVDAFSECLLQGWASFNNLPAMPVGQAELARAQTHSRPHP